MRTLHQMILGLLVGAAASAVWAQPNLEFQNCQPGDLVKVKCQHPLLVLGKATLMEIGSNTVTVCTSSDRFKLPQSEVVLLRLQRPLAAPAPSAPPPASAAAPAGLAIGGQASPAMGPRSGVPIREAIRAMVIDSHKSDAFKEIKGLPGGGSELVVDTNSAAGQKRYDAANAKYDATMKGVENGSVNEADLLKMAKDQLKQIDELQKAGVDTSAYAKEIATMRDFVRRAEAGEKFDFGPSVQ